jgi:hypothetical protein
MFHGRRKLYTAIGIKRLKCARCGQKAIHQWSVCANDSRQLPICLDCDIALNRLALEFMRIPNVDELMAAYESISLSQI